MIGKEKEQRILNSLTKEIATYESQPPSFLKRLVGTNIVYKLSDFMSPELNNQRKIHEGRVKGRVLSFAFLGPLNVFTFLLIARRAPNFVKRIGSVAVAGVTWYMFVQPSLIDSVQFSDDLIQRGIFEHIKNYKTKFDKNPETATRTKFDLEHFTAQKLNSEQPPTGEVKLQQPPTGEVKPQETPNKPIN